MSNNESSDVSFMYSDDSKGIDITGDFAKLGNEGDSDTTPVMVTS